MHHFIRLTTLFLLLGLSSAAREPVSTRNGFSEPSVSVTIIYDNYQGDASLRIDWGFACLVEYMGNKLLFDSGRDESILRENMEKLGIDPGGIPSLFVSHGHADHTAGTGWITSSNPSVKCYLPAGYAEELQAAGNLPEHSTGISNPVHLFGPFYSTGDNFEAFKEQGLVIKTGSGGLLVTGCGHPGIIEMISAVNEDLGIDVHSVIGGLHLLQTPDEQVKMIAEKLQQMGVRQICPTHCTGDRAIAVLKDAFGTEYISGGTGRIIVIE